MQFSVPYARITVSYTTAAAAAARTHLFLCHAQQLSCALLDVLKILIHYKRYGCCSATANNGSPASVLYISVTVVTSTRSVSIYLY